MCNLKIPTKYNNIVCCENKQRTFAVGVLGADKGMFLALCAENREQGSVRKQALPGVIDGKGRGGGGRIYTSGKQLFE